MSAITAADFAKALVPGLARIFGNAYMEHPCEYIQIFEQRKSKRSFEEEVGDTGFPIALPLQELGNIVYARRKQGNVQRYTNVRYGLGHMVSYEARVNDLYDIVVKKGARNLAFSLKQTEEIVHANIFNNAFAAGTTYSDGVSMCSTAHPNAGLNGGTWSNRPTIGSNMSEKSIEADVIAIEMMTNNEGLQINHKPKKLIYHANEMANAQRILKSSQQNDTANNAINALMALGYFRDGGMIYHYLTDTNAYFITTTIPDGLTTYRRENIRYQTDNDFDSDAAKFKGTTYFSCGISDARQVRGNPGLN